MQELKYVFKKNQKETIIRAYANGDFLNELTQGDALFKIMNI